MFKDRNMVRGICFAEIINSMGLKQNCKRYDYSTMTHGLKKGCVVIIYSIVDYYYSSCYGYFFNIKNNMPNSELQEFSHFYRQ